MPDSLTPAAAPAPLPALLSVEHVAALLGCSPRHVRRLSDAGRLPAPVKIGRLIRWRRATLEEWLAAGCPSLRHVAAKGGER